MNIEDGDLLDCDAPIICHQCNCVTNRASGLALSLFQKYTWANVYLNRKEASTPGQIIVSSYADKYVVNMFAQYYGGGPSGTKKHMDYRGMREGWFLECLRNLHRYVSDKDHKIAFPYLIGCGVAKGNWDRYYEMLNIFDKHTTNEVVIIRKVT